MENETNKLVQPSFLDGFICLFVSRLCSGVSLLVSKWFFSVCETGWTYKVDV